MKPSVFFPLIFQNLASEGEDEDEDEEEGKSTTLGFILWTVVTLKLQTLKENTLVVTVSSI